MDFVSIYKNDGIEIEKVVVVTTHDDFPGEAFYKVYYVNHSANAIELTRWVNHRYQMLPAKDSILFWSFQGESTGARRDWVLPLKNGFCATQLHGDEQQ